MNPSFLSTNRHGIRLRWRLAYFHLRHKADGSSERFVFAIHGQHATGNRYSKSRGSDINWRIDLVPGVDEQFSSRNWQEVWYMLGVPNICIVPARPMYVLAGRAYRPLGRTVQNIYKLILN